ncbi:hypothetical protein PG985_000550 [Apiospora marii]|uniref:Uncharacterized protein n=1 Tax=Apiospora marii TaxID=335849 RepID=A0ABR1R2D2_9PEZI
MTIESLVRVKLLHDRYGDISVANQWPTNGSPLGGSPVSTPSNDNEKGEEQDHLSFDEHGEPITGPSVAQDVSSAEDNESHPSSSSNEEDVSTSSSEEAKESTSSEYDHFTAEDTADSVAVDGEERSESSSSSDEELKLGSVTGAIHPHDEKGSDWSGFSDE